MEYARAALDAVVEPGGAVFGGIEVNGGRLAADVLRCFEDCDGEFVRVGGEGRCAGLSGCQYVWIGDLKGEG